MPRPAIRPYPSQYVSEWRMKDGTPVTIRPIRPEDEPLMVQFHTTLSERSVYLRYFCSLSLSTRVEHERLVRICFGSYDRGFALVADRKNPRIRRVTKYLGVGRFSAIDRAEGEAAVIVSDQWQGLGLGTELLAEWCGSDGRKSSTALGRNFARQSRHTSHLQESRIQTAPDWKIFHRFQRRWTCEVKASPDSCRASERFPSCQP